MSQEYVRRKSPGNVSSLTCYLIVAIALHTLSAVALKYCLLKAGIHNPILPATISGYH